MLVETEEKWGLGSPGGGPSGILGEQNLGLPHPLRTQTHTHKHTHKTKIWIHQNLLGHGCRNSPQAACVRSGSGGSGAFLQFLRGCQITLPPSTELHFVSECWCLCELPYEHTGMRDSNDTSAGPSKTRQNVTLVESCSVFQTRRLVLWAAVKQCSGCVHSLTHCIKTLSS